MCVFVLVWLGGCNVGVCELVWVCAGGMGVSMCVLVWMCVCVGVGVYVCIA